jgi:hypothetical protein
MLIHTALDILWATPYPSLQTFGDAALFTSHPIPESIQDETDIFGRGAFEESSKDACKDPQMIGAEVFFP